MKHLLYLFCLPFSMGLFAQDCELPDEFTGNTGSNMIVMLSSNLLSSLNLVSSDPYIVAVTSEGLVVGSSCIALECLNNGNQQLTIWGDDSFTPEIDGANPMGEVILLQIVDGIYLYSLNVSIDYSTNGLSVVESPSSMTYICQGVIDGCLDESACNYNPSATEDDGSCEYPEMFYDCEETCLNDVDLDGVCDELEIVGCIEPMACNYHSTATDEGDCMFADMASCEACSGEIDGSGIIIDFDLDDDGICDSIGCTDPFAMNFSPFATEEDDSCEYLNQIELKNIEFSVYPNPFSNRMSLVCDKTYSHLELSISNTLGAKVYQKSFQNVQANSLIEIDTQAFHSGIYFMNVSSPSALISIPIIKK